MMWRIAGALARGLGYLVAFLGLTIVFVALTFPDDSLRQWVELHGAAATGGELVIEELDVGTMLNSVELRGIALKLPPAKADPAAPGQGPLGGKQREMRLLRADRVRVDASLLGLALSDDKEVQFEADVQGGEIRGGRAQVSPDGAIAVSIAEIVGVRLGTAGLLHGLTGFDVHGVIGGKDISVSKGAAIDDVTAEVDIDLVSARIVKPVIPTQQLGPIELSDIELGDLRVHVRAGKASALSLKKSKRRTADPTVIWLEDVGAAGGDIELQFAETSLITLRPDAPVAKATLDVHFAVHFTDQFLDKKVTRADGEVSQPNKILRMAFKQDARLRTAVRDGVMGITCRGTFEKPNCRPGPTKIRAFQKRKARFAPSGDDATGQDEEPKADKGAPKDEDAAKPTTAGSRSPVPAREAPEARTTSGSQRETRTPPETSVRPGLPTARSSRETPSRPFPVNAALPGSRLNPPTIAPGGRTPGDTAYEAEDPPELEPLDEPVEEEASHAEEHEEDEEHAAADDEEAGDGDEGDEEAGDGDEAGEEGGDEEEEEEE